MLVVRGWILFLAPWTPPPVASPGEVHGGVGRAPPDDAALGRTRLPTRRSSSAGGESGCGRWFGRRQLRLIRWAADGSDLRRAGRVELRRGVNGWPAVAVPAVSAEAGLWCPTSGPHHDRQWLEGSGRDEARGEPLGGGADG